MNWQLIVLLLTAFFCGVYLLFLVINTLRLFFTKNARSSFPIQLVMFVLAILAIYLPRFLTHLFKRNLDIDVYDFLAQRTADLSLAGWFLIAVLLILQIVLSFKHRRI